MKKTIVLLLSVVIAASAMFGCAKKPEEPSDVADGTEAQTAEGIENEPSSDIQDAELSAEEEKKWLCENLPSMDGSTSLIPLEAGIRGALSGISKDEAADLVNHTTTWGAFYNLVNGNTDLIFSCPLSQEQRDMLAEQGVSLEEIPVAMEAFVFAVNTENPVDTLTQQQLRDIYSGKVTNWKELGGNDEEIIAYQRNTDSGSQNYMIDFMGDTPLTDAPTELRPNSMGGLMDAIAVNDNASNAIGYSVYAYAADMYSNSSSVKFIKVDGVAPNRATIADKSYPLLGYNYAMYRSDAPENGSARRLVSFILSEEGQRAVADAGYVAVKELEYDYTVKTAAYTGVGKGGAAPETPGTWETALELYEEKLKCLKDKTLQKEINAFIDESKEKMGGKNTHSRISAKNGYLSVCVYAYSSDYSLNDLSSATWDLRTGKRPTNEEMFFDGVDISKLLTDYIRWYTDYMKQSPGDVGGYDDGPELTSLPENGWSVTVNEICLNNTDSFPTGAMIPLERLPRGNMVTEIPYDMTGLFEESALGKPGDYEKPQIDKRFITWEGNLDYQRLENGSIDVTLLKEDAYPTAAAINRDILDFIKKYYTPEFLDGLVMKDGTQYITDETSRGYSYELLGKYFIIRPYRPWTSDGGYYPYSELRIYDIPSGKQIRWTGLLKDGWYSAATFSNWPINDSSNGLDNAPTLEETEKMYLWELGSINGWFYIILSRDVSSAEKDGIYLTVPYEYVNFE